MFCPEIGVVTPGPGEAVTARLRIAPLPQVLLAETLMFPLLVPATVVIEFVVELPDQPEGNVQL